nr:unnamed protein product [Haemonchus contortus]
MQQNVPFCNGKGRLKVSEYGCRTSNRTAFFRATNVYGTKRTYSIGIKQVVISNWLQFISVMHNQTSLIQK